MSAGRRRGRTNLLTSVVLGATERLARDVEIAGEAFARPGFMKREVDQRTLDRQLLAMSPEDMAALAVRDPQMADRYAKRINELNVRHGDREIPAGEAEYEP